MNSSFGMDTTSGTLALVGAHASFNAEVVDQVGAVISSSLIVNPTTK